MKIKNSLLNLLICLPAIVGSGCEDRRLNNMVEDKVYLNDSGENLQNIFKWENFTYQLQAIKSGVGQQGGEVALHVDEALLAQFGDKYTLLPAELYKIKTPQVSFGEQDYSVPFEIEFNAAGIETLQAATELVYAVPVRISSNTIKPAGENQLYSLVIPQVLDPYIQFKTPGLAPGTAAISTANSPAETRFYAFLQTNYHNKTDLQYKVEVSEAALKAYNLANETTHKLLPAAGYRIDETTFTIANLNNEQALSYYLIKGKVPNGDYMLPLEITTVSKYGIDPSRSTILIPVSIQD
ncbi:DUF1735 domain-containing protein [Dyadobacter aurulentus]|uniref:DUF1735 domain-containing protein n=1 Tax=Dyadobacter sp. UC 10 TaxID=2605428 RepID=UPI001788AD30|nr:DUF1735 domain-containing protein [Dyadobacter sp. UC 10]